ncbi:hypothetical protein O3G_MSEX007299 [Manduca sexta]|nr:hypothetical protein O3G_MSEX007299 [Manduca sexta]
MMAVNIVLFLSLCVVVKGNLIVDTSSGKVEGVEVPSIIKNEKYYSFMGIPYAQPPIGELRFMPPIPHQGWSNVLNAKKESKACSQFYLPSRTIEDYGFYGDEDCLRLGIHTPKVPVKDELSFPVIVFFYNEYFRLSFNGSREYGPDFFMKEDVMIVNINYRVGPMGFISYEDDLLPGNNGIKDVILALKWLQQNIHKFGGDPYKVTLMGNEGGGVLVDILLQSPKAKGLFSAVIMQSGTTWQSMYFNGKPRDKALALAKELEKHVSTSAQLIKEFSEFSAQKISESELHSIPTDDSRHAQVGILGNSPVIEHDHPDAIINQLPEDSHIKIDIPIMIGYNSNEGLEKCERFLRKPQYLTFADRDFLMMFPIRVHYHFEINTNVYWDAVQEVKDFYFEEGYVKISKPGEYMMYHGDASAIYPIDYTVRKYLNISSAPIYYYAFDYSGELNMRKNLAMEEALTVEGTWGATTGDELCYLFVCNKIKKAYIKAMEDEDSEEMKVLKNMVRMWTNFAKTG